MNEAYVGIPDSIPDPAMDPLITAKMAHSSAALLPPLNNYRVPDFSSSGQRAASPNPNLDGYVLRHQIFVKALGRHGPPEHVLFDRYK